MAPLASVEELAEWHSADLRLANLRESSIRQRIYVLGRLARHLGPTHILEAEPRDLTMFLARPLSPESRAVETTHVRQFYEWCIDVELLDLSPARRLRRPRVPRGLPLPIGEGDLAMAVDLAPDRIRPWLVLAAFAGLRACEIAPLRAEDLWHHTDPQLIIIAEGKGGHATSVPMSSHLAELLRRCDLTTSGDLFPRHDGTPGHVPAHLVSHISNRFLHSIGITSTLHKLRHRFGTELLKASGGNLRVTQEGMRHESSRSTERYTFVAPAEVAAAVEALPELRLDRDDHLPLQWIA